MSFTAGQIVEGKVTGITNFGAFVELAPGTTGLVHISEVADTYVKDVKDFINEGDTVKVKVLTVAGKKIGLSIKQAAPPKPVEERPRYNRPHNTGSGSNNRYNNSGSARTAQGAVTLDDKIARFMKESDERMQPLKNRLEPKRRNRNS